MNRTQAWETGFHKFMDSNHPEVLREVKQACDAQQNMSDDLQAKLRQAIEEYYRSLSKKTPQQ